ncbi:MAG: hypothetical protein ACTHMS_22355 [Jatrophihabitans sp.]|uniref:hypothetical protein n=1 Tax=Jatrophihabitans sp. TaxID=1932789 RepID=UPI003F820093
MSLPVPRRTARFVVRVRVRWERSLPGVGVRRVRELSLDTHALAFGAQQLLCTAPLVVAVGAMFRHRPGHGTGIAIARFFGLEGESARAVEGLFGRTSPSIGFWALLLSLVTAVVFAAGVGAVQQRAFELIWDLPTVRSVRTSVQQLAWVPVLTLFVLALLVSSRLTARLDAQSDGLGDAAMIVSRVVVVTLFYWWSQRLLLARRVPWRDLLPGSIAIGVLTTGTLEVAHLIMPEQITWQLHAYGPVGVVFVLSVWIVGVSTFIYAGALFGALLAERRRERATAVLEAEVSVTEFDDLDDLDDVDGLGGLPAPAAAG